MWNSNYFYSYNSLWFLEIIEYPCIKSDALPLKIKKTLDNKNNTPDIVNAISKNKSMTSL